MLYHKSNCSRILIGSIDGQSGDDVINMFLFLYCIKQMDSLLPCVCSVIDHRRQRTSKCGKNMNDTASAVLLCPFFVLAAF